MYAVCFTLTALTGAILGAYDVSGTIGKYNFVAMAVFGIVPTWIGVFKAYEYRKTGLQKLQDEHRAWMLRSYAH